MLGIYPTQSCAACPMPNFCLFGCYFNEKLITVVVEELNFFCELIIVVVQELNFFSE